MTRPLAIVTGASTGIGLELAKLAALDGHDLLIASDTPQAQAEAELRSLGAGVEALQADLSTTEGVDRLLATLGGREVAVLCANAGHGLGHAFLDQDWRDIRHVIDTNVTGTVYLLHRMGRLMRGQGGGRILVTGSIAGYTPQPFQAVYHATKAFMDNFTIAFREELKPSGVSVTLLMPGATETEFFDRAAMNDTKLGEAKKDDPADVAKTGWEAMKSGTADVVHGFKNKVATTMADVVPAETSARMAANQAKPGSGKKAG
jgi:short-subunit dehydrogenase